jgi:hypothetical protein
MAFVVTNAGTIVFFVQVFDMVMCGPIGYKDSMNIHVTPTLYNIAVPRYTHVTPTLHPRYTHVTPTLHPRYTHVTPTLHPRYTHATPTLHPRPHCTIETVRLGIATKHTTIHHTHTQGRQHLI